MKLHKGIRPVGEIKAIRTDLMTQYNYQEVLENGHVRLWTNRMLRSGCNQEVKEIKTLSGLIYCPHCDEYFSQNQFLELGE